MGLGLAQVQHLGGERAPLHFWRAGFQYRSRDPHPGFPYCAVDSMTTSSTSRWSSHWASRCTGSGVAPHLRRSNSNSPSAPTSHTTTANIFLGTSTAATRSMMLSFGRSGEHAKSYHMQGHGLSCFPQREKTIDAQLFAQSAHAPDQTDGSGSI